MYGRMLLAGAVIAMFCQNAAGHGRGTDNPGGRPSHAQSFFPAPGAAHIHVDTRLKIVLDGPPSLGTSGKINVYRVSDNALADSIDVGDAWVTAGGETQTAVPRANTPIELSGLDTRAEISAGWNNGEGWVPEP